MAGTGSVTGAPSRKSGEWALAPGNSTSLPTSNPGASVVVVVDEDEDEDEDVVDDVVEVLVDVLVEVVVLVDVVVLVCDAHAPHALPCPWTVPPAALHVASSRATRAHGPLQSAPASQGTQQTTAVGFPHVDRAAQRATWRPASLRQCDRLSALR